MRFRSVLRRFLDKSGKYKMYFLRGHNSWFYFAFYIINFTVIIYKLLLEDLSLPDWMNFSYFFLLFVFLYIPISTIVGMLDYKKGTFRGEALLSLEVNPITQKMFENQELILKQQKELEDQLKKLLENERKWN